MSRHRILASALALWSLTAACASAPPPPPLTQQRPLSALMTAAAYPNADTVTLFVTMQQLLSSHREREGYDFFGRLADRQPQRAPLLRALQATMQARLAPQVPLLRRVAWIDDAIAKLDGGVAAEPVRGRLLRGMVLAELPARFGKAQQAIDDLQSSLAQPGLGPFGLERGMYRGLAAAYHTLGDEQRSRAMLARAGLPSLNDGGEPRIAADLSVSADRGFRFGMKRLVREADGVYVAEGYDFANLVFFVSPQMVVAVDAGTTEETTREAVVALRRITAAPIKYVILTHGHWDHVGGLNALREPGTVVIASATFPEQLAHARAYRPPFRYFFGTGTMNLDVRPDRLIAGPETLSAGGLELRLIPAPSGETSDALFVEDAAQGLLVVGDAFMPYLGAPFVAEGSPEAFLAAIDAVLALRPRRLIHGHPPLTALFTIQAMPGLRDAMQALYARTLGDAQAARPLAEVLHDDFLPPSLREAPLAVQPFLVTRDTFVQRLYAGHAGYWQSNGDGIDAFTRAEWAAVLDQLGGGGEQPFARAAHQLEAGGDAALALRIAELGLQRHPASVPLARERAHALSTLREIYAQTNPFRFIVYSDFAGRGLDPVAPTIDASTK